MPSAAKAFCSVACCLLTVLLACAQQPKEPAFNGKPLSPASPGVPVPASRNVRSEAPPSFVAILGFDKATGTINLAEFRVDHVPFLVEKAIQKDGKPEKVRVTLYKPVTRQVGRSLRFEDVQFFTGDGKPLEKTKAMEHLARGGMALLSADGNPVDSRYLTLLRTDVLILVIRQLQPKKE